MLFIKIIFFLLILLPSNIFQNFCWDYLSNGSFQVNAYSFLLCACFFSIVIMLVCFLFFSFLTCFEFYLRIFHSRFSIICWKVFIAVMSLESYVSIFFVVFSILVLLSDTISTICIFPLHFVPFFFISSTVFCRVHVISFN